MRSRIVAAGLAVVLVACVGAADGTPCVPTPLEPTCPTPRPDVPPLVVSGVHVFNVELGAGYTGQSSGGRGLALDGQLTSLVHYGAPGGALALLGGGYFYTVGNGSTRSLLSVAPVEGVVFFGSKSGSVCAFPWTCGNTTGRIGIQASAMQLQYDFPSDRYAERFVDARLALSVLGPAFYEDYEHAHRLVLSVGGSAEHVGHAGLGDGKYVGRVTAGADFTVRFGHERWELGASAAFRPRPGDVGLDASVGLTLMGEAAPVLRPWRVNLRSVYSYWSDPSLAIGERASPDAMHTFTLVLSFQPTFYRIP